MLKARFQQYQLHFKNPVLTSRGSMSVKNGYYLFVSDAERTGVGECSFIEGLSPDNLTNYESVLADLCNALEKTDPILSLLEAYPSINFGMETAFRDFEHGGQRILYPSQFTKGENPIGMNGLIWMGDLDFMKKQMEKKLEEGFRCIKIKVGALNFEQELNLLRSLRDRFPKELIEIRLDANGAYTEENVFHRLEKLADYHIHSIEQPVKSGQAALMQKVCKLSPIPIALDEELIGVPTNEQEALLAFIQPQYIILKPSLLGGFAAAEDWIRYAQKRKIKWWATSALESNIGLNAIAQWVFTKNNPLVQGLGTGDLYSNNISSPLFTMKGSLHFNPSNKWGSFAV